VNKAVGEECAGAMRKIVAEIEEILDSNDEDAVLEMKKLFEAEEIRDPIDFLYAVADMGAMAVQYGNKDEFCEIVMEEQSIANYAEAGLEMLRKFNMSTMQLSFQSAESTAPDDYLDGFGMRSWLYQSCTEYGYFQNAYNDPEQSVRSAQITPEYHRDVCERLFEISDEVPVEKIREEFYEPLLDSSKTSHIFFTNGANDPWALLGITLENGNNTNNETDTVTIEDAAHCEDLGSKSSPAIREARTAFTVKLKDWLELNGNN
jgi:hypothetical protein